MAEDKDGASWALLIGSFVAIGIVIYLVARKSTGG